MLCQRIGLRCSFHPIDTGTVQPELWSPSADYQVMYSCILYSRDNIRNCCTREMFGSHRLTFPLHSTMLLEYTANEFVHMYIVCIHCISLIITVGVHYILPFVLYLRSNLVSCWCQSKSTWLCLWWSRLATLTLCSVSQHPCSTCKMVSQ